MSRPPGFFFLGPAAILKEETGRIMMVVTDLDGTLLNRNREISSRDLQTLIDLGRRGIIRTIATGRSLYSARKVIHRDWPIDYLVFSSGAGIMDWEEQKLLLSHSMSMDEVALVFRFLRKLELDFMLHNPIPENHRFIYFPTSRDNHDFARRCSLYREFASPGNAATFRARSACQYLAIEPHHPRGAFRYALLRSRFTNLSVLRTTSPLDGRSIWIEIFNRRVSKAQAASWLADLHLLSRQEVLALGNDYNDLDLLDWAGQSYVVDNAQAELKRLYPSVRANDQAGFSEAVVRWSG